MSWHLSRFRAGDFIVVRSKEEILATLDAEGCLEGLPFMPEMLQFCGQRYQVRAVAHKTCETANKTYKSRRLGASVHLANLTCNGANHGGCEALCPLFWKDAWLIPANEAKQSPEERTIISPSTAICSEELLIANAQLPTNPIEKEPHYSCQATKIYNATEPLKWWDLRQYLFDVLTRNHSLGRVLRVTSLASLRALIRKIKVGKKFSDWTHHLMTGRGAPSISPKIKLGQRTPEGWLNLQPGELVRIKSKSEIEETINENSLNRGLSFDCEEMAPYCGRVFRVKKSVTKILDESTGKMLDMKQPCIVLEGVVCNAEYASCRLNCPRTLPCFWRELWLDRVTEVS